MVFYLKRTIFNIVSSPSQTSLQNRIEQNRFLSPFGSQIRNCKIASSRTELFFLKLRLVRTVSTACNILTPHNFSTEPHSKMKLLLYSNLNSPHIPPNLRSGNKVLAVGNQASVLHGYLFSQTILWDFQKSFQDKCKSRFTRRLVDIKKKTKLGLMLKTKPLKVEQKKKKELCGHVCHLPSRGKAACTR